MVSSLQFQWRCRIFSGVVVLTGAAGVRRLLEVLSVFKIRLYTKMPNFCPAADMLDLHIAKVGVVLVAPVRMSAPPAP